jgi:hypothetical protein
MNVKKLKIVGLLAMALALLAVSACSQKQLRVGDLKTESEAVELGDSGAVDVEIMMAAGELDVSGGAADLLSADFTYNVAELEPEVELKGDKLSVLTPDVEYTGVGSFWDIDEYRYEWDLRLINDVPMDMDITMGAGRANLDLGSLALLTLNLETGAGDVTLDLSDSSSLSRLTVEAGVGELALDLSGDWGSDLDADIQSGIGELTVLLPRDAGVRLDVGGGIGQVNTSGLKKDGDSYVNDAYGDSDVTLRLDIQAGIGKLNLEVSG